MGEGYKVINAGTGPQGKARERVVSTDIKQAAEEVVHQTEVSVTKFITGAGDVFISAKPILAPIARRVVPTAVAESVGGQLVRRAGPGIGTIFAVANVAKTGYDATQLPEGSPERKKATTNFWWKVGAIALGCAIGLFFAPAGAAIAAALWGITIAGAVNGLADAAGGYAELVPDTDLRW